MEAVVHAVNETGFGLTFGVHSRIDETIERLTGASDAGNQYVNRNMIGAVVGVQPFGGHGLSGTGPKAGGPLYVHRLLAQPQAMTPASGELSGPVGERNLYRQRPKGTILCVAADSAHLEVQRAAVAATGNRATTDAADADLAAALFAGSAEQLLALTRQMAAREGRIVPVHVEPYPLEFLSDEISLSENTAAAGGNASLMTIG
jgi:RHH-type proline utilization regulon transcriptional repressor/proline dehydrogenase/delta 1-pyrroline-5-carboxylate dehydrogenase